jgi:hypothetical protein
MMSTMATEKTLTNAEKLRLELNLSPFHLKIEKSFLIFGTKNETKGDGDVVLMLMCWYGRSLLRVYGTSSVIHLA